MKSFVRSAIVAALVAVPSFASAQRRIAVQAEIGGAPTGAVDPYATTGGAFGRIGVLVPFGPEAEIEFAGEGFLNPRTTSCTQCLADFPNVLGGIASLVIALGSPYDEHKITMSVGGGPYRFSTDRNPTFTSFGGELGLQMIAKRSVRASVILDARAIIVPNTDAGRVWMIPVTIGLRF
jgi:hypothetical protein